MKVLLNRAGVGEDMLQGVDTLYKVGCKGCDLKGRMKIAPVMSESIFTRLGECVEADIFHDADGDSILGLIDKTTGFCSAEFVKKHTSRSLQEAFVVAWWPFGFQESILTDLERGFGSDEWIEFLRSNQIVPRSSLRGAYFQVGMIERHNAFLKELYASLRSDFPKENKHTVLKMALMATNSMDTYRGFPPAMRVLGQQVRIPDILQGDLPHFCQHTECDATVASPHMLMIHRGRELHTRLQTCEKLRRAQGRTVRESGNHQYRVGDRVFWFQNVVKKSQKGWCGPAVVIGADRGLILIRHGQRLLQLNQTRLRLDTSTVCGPAQLEDVASLDPAGTKVRITKSETEPTQGKHIDIEVKELVQPVQPLGLIKIDMPKDLPEAADRY